MSKRLNTPSLSIEILPVKDLLPYQRALRNNAKAVERMVASIREYGFKIPLLVSGQKVIIDGELRFKAAQKLKYTEVPVIVCHDWSAEQLSAFRLMANRSATWAEWDLEAVAQEIAELSKTDFDLKLTGFDACEIEQFLAPVFDDQTLESVPETPHTP
jgi:ParB-like chromosome segregation protein Spo0J